MNPDVLIIFNVIVVVLMVLALIYNKQQRDKVFEECNNALREASRLHDQAIDNLYELTYGRQFSIPEEYKDNPDAYIQIQKEALLNIVRREAKERMTIRETSPGEFLLLVKFR